MLNHNRYCIYRTEVFELGASNMDISVRGKVLEKWKKAHRTAHERLEKWTPVHKNKLTYPELMNQVREDRAEAFNAKVCTCIAGFKKYDTSFFVDW